MTSSASSSKSLGGGGKPLPPVVAEEGETEQSDLLGAWSTCPRSLLESLVTSSVKLNAWFLPQYHPKLKLREFGFTLSPVRGVGPCFWAVCVPAPRRLTPTSSSPQDLRTLSWTYHSKRLAAERDFSTPLLGVVARRGLPLGPPRKNLLGRSPKPDLSVCLDGMEGETSVLHLEADTEQQAADLSRLLSLLAAYSRAVTGIAEPLPDAWVDAAALVAAVASGAGGGAPEA